MALFKILKGNKTNLPENKVDGYCYVTLDEHKLYVDHKTASGTLERFALNAVNADTATMAYKLSTNAGDENHPVYFDGGIPHACNTIKNDIDSYDITGHNITVTNYLGVVGDDDSVNRHGVLLTPDTVQFNNVDQHSGKGTISRLSDSGFSVANVNDFIEPEQVLIANPNMIGLAHNTTPGDQVTGMMDGVIGFATITEEGNYTPGVVLTPDGLQGNATTANLADQAKALTTTQSGSSSLPVYFDGGVPTPIEDLKGMGEIEATDINIDGKLTIISEADPTHTTEIFGNNITVKNILEQTAVVPGGVIFTDHNNEQLGWLDYAEYTGKAASAGEADKLAVNGGDDGHPIYFDGGIPHECSVINTDIDSDQVQTKNLIVNNTDDNPVIVAGTNENHEPCVAVTVSENNTALLGSYQNIPIAGIFHQRDDDTVYVSGACGEWLASGIMNDSGTSLTGALITNQMIGFVTSDGINNVPDGAILTPAGLLGNADTATLAEEAKRLKVNGGSSSRPVYFDGGVPTECTSIEGMTSVKAQSLWASSGNNSIIIQPNDDIGIKVIQGNTEFDITPAELKKLNALANNTTGNESTPIYFNNGVPAACGDTLGVNITGNAATAGRLTSDNGTSTKPVYFDGGVPTECDIDMADLLPLSAGENKKLIGALGLTEGVMYGTEAPESGFEGQLFFVEDDSNPLPKGGNAGQILIKNSSEDGDASWGEIVALPDGGTAGQALIKNSTSDGDASWQDIVALPKGGNVGQYLVKNSSTEGDASWQSLNISNKFNAGTTSGPSIQTTIGDYTSSAIDIPAASGSTSGIVTTDVQSFAGAKTFNSHISSYGTIRSYSSSQLGAEIWTDSEGGNITIYPPSSTGVESWNIDSYNGDLRWYAVVNGTAKTGPHIKSSNMGIYGAVWNDYAEFRTQKEVIEPGYCVASADNGQVYKTTEKFQACDGIVSDTFGFAIGETDECKTPLAVAGRVLAYCEGNRYDYHSGDTVCAGPDGKVVKMTREEIREWPDRIIGIVSEIPEYETWGTGNVAVNGRIWIKVK